MTIDVYSYLEKKNPLLAFQLSHHQFLADKSYPLRTLERQLEFDAIDTLYIFGVSFLHDEVFAWLYEKKLRSIIFFEDDLDRLASFLQKMEAQKYLEENQITFCYLDTLEKAKQILWERVFTSSHYISNNQTEWKGLVQNLEVGIFLTASNYSDFGIQSYQNLRKNFQVTDSKYISQNKPFKGVPAIILGAGPSLSKDLGGLKKHTDRALFFSGGAALSLLDLECIPLDFVAAIDPFPPKSRLYEHMYTNHPLFYLNRVHHDLLTKYNADQILAGITGGIPLEKYLLEQPVIDAGWTVVNFQIQIAKTLGCSPIILVGCDFCYPKDKRYADGVTPSNDTKVQLECVKNINGEDVVTTADFKMSAYWIEEQIEQGLHVVNTSSGLKIEGAEHIALNKASNKYLLETFDFSKNFLEKAFEKSNKKKEYVQITLKKIDTELMRLSKILKEGIACTNSQNMDTSLLDFEVETSFLFEELLQPIWEVWKYPIFREKQAELPKKIARAVFFKDVINRFMEVGCKS